MCSKHIFAYTFTQFFTCADAVNHLNSINMDNLPTIKMFLSVSVILYFSKRGHCLLFLADN